MFPLQQQRQHKHQPITFDNIENSQENNWSAKESRSCHRRHCDDRLRVGAPLSIKISTSITSLGC